MKLSRKWTRRAILWSGAGALTVATVVAGSVAQAAHTTSGRPAAAASSNGIGYPPPKGIYAPFTDCPLINPLMKESTPSDATACVAGQVLSGSIKIGNVTTKIGGTVRTPNPVLVQFGLWSPPNAVGGQFTGGVLPPAAGLSAMLFSNPQFVRGGLLKALGCPNANATVEALCTEAQKKRGKDLQIYAAAQSAGPITNFQLTTWTQPVMFHLINPLLGSNCYIGSQDDPVVINPSLTGGSLAEEMDPHPRYHPDTAVLAITSTTAADTTFAAPGVTGCGPGGSANIAVDEAIDTADALPSASGSNSISLSGNFYLADCFAPANQSTILLNAFRASARSGGTAVLQRISRASLRDQFGIRLNH